MDLKHLKLNSSNYHPLLMDSKGLVSMYNQSLKSYDENELKNLIEIDITFKEFFENSKINPNAYLIKGTICGYRIEEIDNQLTQKVRFLDKLVDELARGKKMEKILRFGIE